MKKIKIQQTNRKEGKLDFQNICRNCRVNGINQYCCQSGGSLILPREKGKILDKMGKVYSRYFKKEGPFYLLKARTGRKCPFLKNGECQIQEIKPLICKIFPVRFYENSAKITYLLSTPCPAIRRLSQKELRKQIKQAKKDILKIPKPIRKAYASLKFPKPIRKAYANYHIKRII